MEYVTASKQQPRFNVGFLLTIIYFSVTVFCAHRKFQISFCCFFVGCNLRAVLDFFFFANIAFYLFISSSSFCWYLCRLYTVRSYRNRINIRFCIDESQNVYVYVTLIKRKIHVQAATDVKSHFGTHWT